MLMDRPVNLSGGEAAFAFRALAADVFAGATEDVHRYFVSDLSYVAIPTPGPALMSMLPYLQSRGFLPESSLFSRRQVNRLLMLGSGVTEGFEYVLGILKADVDAESARRGEAIRPAILFPVPTYGYFIEAAERRGFKPLLIRRDLSNGGRLDPADVAGALDRADDEGLRLVAYYDCNPHNPLGLIRGRDETETLARMIAGFSETYRRRDLDRAGTSGHEAEAGVWNGPAARVRIIDDLVYDGLEFDGEVPASSFAECDEVRDDVIILLGLSKIGLAGLRAGLMIADPEFIRRTYPLQNASSYFPNLPAMKAIEGYYRHEEAFARRRRDHLRALSQTHRFRGRLMQALVDGFAAVPDLADGERERMIDSVVEHAGIERSAAAERLTRGIARARIVTNPSAGFFHLLDLSAVKGMSIALSTGETVGPVLDEVALEAIERDYRFHVCFGVWTGLDAADMVQRVSFAVPESEIVAAAERLDDMLSRFSLPKQRTPRKRCGSSLNRSAKGSAAAAPEESTLSP